MCYFCLVQVAFIVTKNRKNVRKIVWNCNENAFSFSSDICDSFKFDSNFFTDALCRFTKTSVLGIFCSSPRTRRFIRIVCWFCQQLNVDDRWVNTFGLWQSSSCTKARARTRQYDFSCNTWNGSLNCDQHKMKLSNNNRRHHIEQRKPYSIRSTKLYSTPFQTIKYISTSNAQQNECSPGEECQIVAVTQTYTHVDAKHTLFPFYRNSAFHLSSKCSCKALIHLIRTHVPHLNCFDAMFISCVSPTINFNWP